MLLALTIAGLLAGCIASVAGFGIGSVLTPVLSTATTASLAVAAVSIPHLLATAYRLWLVRASIDYRLLRSFGLMSAAGGLLGALVHAWIGSRALEIVLAVLLLAVGIGTLTGFMSRLRFAGFWAWVAGAVSGFLGGLVGNQGGLRAGAMVGFGVSRDAFVATSTAIGLIVDLARIPVYLVGNWNDLLMLWPAVAVMSASVLVGTWFGIKLLRRLPEHRFLQMVAVLLMLLAGWLVAKPWLMPSQVG